MTDHRYIIGPPGTGKTSTLKREVDLASNEFGADQVLVCSLTKAAAATSASRKTPSAPCTASPTGRSARRPWPRAS